MSFLFTYYGKSVTKVHQDRPGSIEINQSSECEALSREAIVCLDLRYM